MSQATVLGSAPPSGAGALLRDWRRRRRLSQLDLALSAEISTRHLSFVETGRARPSREMLLRLAETMELPLRVRNELLLAAGHAPAFAETDWTATAMEPVRTAVARLLAAHAPNPAMVVDGRWTLLEANAAVPALLGGVAPELLAPPVNVVRLALHPDGLVRNVVNAGEWRAHLLARLRRQVTLTADPVLTRLYAEALRYPVPPGPMAGHDHAPELVVPLRLATPAGELALISTIATFGTPADITPDELVIETFFPADDATAARLRTLTSAG